MKTKGDKWVVIGAIAVAVLLWFVYSFTQSALNDPCRPNGYLREVNPGKWVCWPNPK